MRVGRPDPVENLLSIIVALSCHHQSKIGTLDVAGGVAKVEDSIARSDVHRNGDVLTDGSMADRDESCKGSDRRKHGHI